MSPQHTGACLAHNWSTSASAMSNRSAASMTQRSRPTKHDLEDETQVQHNAIVDNIHGFGDMPGGHFQLAEMIKLRWRTITSSRTADAELSLIFHNIRSELRRSGGNAPLPILTDDMIKNAAAAFKARHEKIKTHVNQLSPLSDNAKDGKIIELTNYLDDILREMFTV
jgi:hypothetical protein